MSEALQLAEQLGAATLLFSCLLGTVMVYVSWSHSNRTYSGIVGLSNGRGTYHKRSCQRWMQQKVVGRSS